MLAKMINVKFLRRRQSDFMCDKTDMPGIFSGGLVQVRINIFGPELQNNLVKALLLFEADSINLIWLTLTFKGKVISLKC